MKVFLNQIPEKGLALDQSISAWDLDLPEDVFCCLGPLTLEGVLQHVGDEILANVAVSGRYRFSCVRCLKEYEIEKVDRFELVFDVDSETASIDLAESLRDELIISASVNPCCRSGCRGICAGCGADLNTEQCRCNNVNQTHSL